MPMDSFRRASAALAVVTVLAFAAGCNGEKEQDGGYQPVGKNQPEVPEPAGHPEEGAHGGHLYDLGDHEFFAEVVLDEASRKVTIYVVEHDDVNKAVPMDAAGAKLVLEVGEQPVELELTAVPQQGEPEGKASRFELAGDQLPAEVKSEEQLHGELMLSRDGKAYEVHLEPHEHEEHEGHPPRAGQE